VLLINVTLVRAQSLMGVLVVYRQMDPVERSLQTMRLARAVVLELAAALMATVVILQIIVVSVHVIQERVLPAPIFPPRMANAVLYTRVIMSAKEPHSGRAAASMDTVAVVQTSALQRIRSVQARSL
jgi:hypothetical protein